MAAVYPAPREVRSILANGERERDNGGCTTSVVPG